VTPTVEQQAAALLRRHVRKTAVRVAETYAAQSDDRGSASRTKFWDDVAALLQGDVTVEEIERRAAERARPSPRRRLLAKLEALSLPLDVAAALAKLPLDPLWVVVEYLETRRP